MACYKPLTAYITAHQINNAVKGVVTKFNDGKKGGNAYRSISFKEQGEHDREIQLPCGKCIGCRLEQSRQKAVRCMHESKMHDENSFITLTYSDQNLPPNNSLVKKDVQDFLKRLRDHLKYHHEGKKIRYFMCGEYGENFGRPHYHIILFGHDWEDKKYKFTSNSKSRVYTSETLDKLWGKGITSTGNVTFESAAYVARYVMKKVTGKPAIEHYGEIIEKDTGEIKPKKLPEYNAMSLKPGIGATWFNKYKKDVYPSDQVIIRNKPTKPPRYYDKLFNRIDPLEFERIQHNRYIQAKEKFEDNTIERLQVKEKVTEAKLKQLQRKLK
jgi:hypothetical protein